MKNYNYDMFAEYYDQIEANEKIKSLNHVLDSICKKQNVSSILDITCGTGEQAIYLHKKGYHVVASDLNKSMLAIARKKYPKIAWHHGDMQHVRYGKFDAVISIYNAIAHLSKKDFEQAIRNISANLNQNGMYIFDIFNAAFMHRHFIAYEFIDRCIEIESKKIARFNKNNFDRRKNIMRIKQKTYLQDELKQPKIIKEKWDMQIYTVQELQEMLKRNGFAEGEFFSIDGSRFDQQKSLSILCVAKKKRER